MITTPLGKEVTKPVQLDNTRTEDNCLGATSDHVTELEHHFISERHLIIVAPHRLLIQHLASFKFRGYEAFYAEHNKRCRQ